jgi:phosphoribosylanthranilate isomerase
MLVAAGGLQPSIVAEAVRRLRPDVVDVSSGVEIRPGIKDPGRVRAFIRNARGAHDAPPDSAPERDSGPSPVLEPDSEQDD